MEAGKWWPISGTQTGQRLASRRTHYRPLKRIHRKIAKVEEEISPRFQSLLRRMNFPE